MENRSAFDRARTLLAENRPGLAWEAIRPHLLARPEDAHVRLLAAQIQLGLARLEEATEHLRTAVALNPSLADHPECRATSAGIEAMRLTLRAQALQQQGAYADAGDLLHRAVDLLPDRPWPRNNLGRYLMEVGQLDDAIDQFRHAADHPAYPMRVASSNLLLAMMHHDRYTPRQLLDEHVRQAARYRPVKQYPPPPRVRADPEGPIRVGYISPDFRDHPVATFIAPVLEHHDRSRFEITCYHDAPNEDAVTHRLRGFGHRWVDSASMGIDQLFERIRTDRIDVLIDLAVHSGFNRQRLLAARVAPIQMTWLGYAGSTGSSAVDYRITDAVVDPPGLTESHFTEQLLRLPKVLWCFSPPPAAPELLPRASRSDPRIRIGTATRLAKLSAGCLELWSQLLHRLPESTLCLAAAPLGDPELRRRWVDRFAAAGIDPSRLELRGGMSYADYLTYLGSLDIGLDTFPFNGGTTVCQTLWMGTPLAAIAGDRSGARVSASILNAIGRAEWIADTPDQWLRINEMLASDSSISRVGLRQQMMGSALCDGRGFTRELEAALLRVISERCRN